VPDFKGQALFIERLFRDHGRDVASIAENKGRPAPFVQQNKSDKTK
jgi:hypothetical protein